MAEGEDSREAFQSKDLRRGKRVLFGGLDSDQLIQGFFGGNAFVAILVLLAITVFLFKEGVGFFQMNLDSLRAYRWTGQEYVDYARQQNDDFQALVRYLNDIRTKEMERAREQAIAAGRSEDEAFQAARAAVEKEDEYIRSFSRLGDGLRRWLLDQQKIAISIKEDYEIYLNNLVQAEFWESEKEAVSRKAQRLLKEAGQLQLYEVIRAQTQEAFQNAREMDNLERLQREVETAFNSDRDEVEATVDERIHTLLADFLPPEQVPAADASETLLRGAFNAYLSGRAAFKLSRLKIEPVDFDTRVQPILDAYPQYVEITNQLAAEITEAAAAAPALESEYANERMQRFQELAEIYVDRFPEYREGMEEWKLNEPVKRYRAITSFFFGDDWITNSSWRDWYGILPLFTGSLIICTIAIVIAVPFGVGGAIYANQIATRRELNIIKPYIEFIAAIPSIVIGFFGIVVFGYFVREASTWQIFEWVPFFPIRERLNAFTAGCLLALMAIPTIFSLAEDAINNVPLAYKEASYAMGATRFQTTIRIIVPSALSGIISAILLGFGRVIGETMVVLLCAGNRIQIPDFTEGLGIFFQPVHTMTGIVAQEIPEVASGSIHWRALFMVAIFLFMLSLLINWTAQKMVRRYKLTDA